MKNLSLLSVILLFPFNGINAQKEDLNTRHYIHSDVPEEVLASVEAGNHGLNFTPPLLTESAPVIKKEKKLIPSERVFQVCYTGKNYWKKETFNKEGVLIYSSTVAKNKMLPSPVYQHIGREYPGWALKRNIIIKKTKRSKNGIIHLTYFKLLLQKEGKKLRIVLDERGNVYSGKR